jgi:hypothetical protein
MVRVLPRRVWLPVAAALVAVGAAALPAARAQEAPIEPLARPITVFVLDKPTVTVSFVGDYGPAQVTGVLAEAPKGPLLLRGAGATTREATWGELRQISNITRPVEGAEKGWTGTLVSDAIPVRLAQGAGRVSVFYESAGWYAATLPEGELKLTGPPYGSLSVATGRIETLRQEPVRGTVTALPAAPLRVQVFDGKPFTVSLADVVTYRRDLPRQLVSVVLEDGQSFTARALDLPKVAVPILTEAGPRSIPFEQIGLLEWATPGGRLSN